MPAAPLDAAMLLALWERALIAAPIARAGALLDAFDGAETIQTLGADNARLLGIHAELFGGHLALMSRCPHCHETAEFSGDCEALASTATMHAAGPEGFEAQGYAIEFRLPMRADVEQASSAASAEEFAQRLMVTCVQARTPGGVEISPAALPEPVLQALSQRMEALDPAASIAFALECPACATSWTAGFDVGDALWQKVRAAAEQLMLEVDALARRYGWTESDVLRLSPGRRAAYLQLVAA